MDERCGIPDDFYPPKETCALKNGHGGDHAGEFGTWPQGGGEELERCGAVDDGETCRRPKGHSDGHDGERHAWPTDEQIPGLERRMTELMSGRTSTGTDEHQDEDELGPFTDDKLSEWMDDHRIDTCTATYDYDGTVVRCVERAGHFGDHSDDRDGWLAWSQDGAVTGGTLMYGDPDADYDEHTAFWQSWTRMAIAWGLVLVGALLLLSGYRHGIVHIVVVSVAVGAAGCVAKLVYDAVRFTWDERRGE